MTEQLDYYITGFQKEHKKLIKFESYLKFETEAKREKYMKYLKSFFNCKSMYFELLETPKKSRYDIMNFEL